MFKLDTIDDKLRLYDSLLKWYSISPEYKPYDIFLARFIRKYDRYIENTRVEKIRIIDEIIPLLEKIIKDNYFKDLEKIFDLCYLNNIRVDSPHDFVYDMMTLFYPYELYQKDEVDYVDRFLTLYSDCPMGYDIKHKYFDMLEIYKKIIRPITTKDNDSLACILYKLYVSIVAIYYANDGSLDDLRNVFLFIASNYDYIKANFIINTQSLHRFSPELFYTFAIDIIEESKLYNDDDNVKG